MSHVVTTKNPVTECSAAKSSMAELRWQCRRGMLELDLLLNRFLETQYSQLDATRRETFVTLLSYPDQTLYELLMDKMASSNPAIAEIVKNIRSSAVIPV